MKKYMNNEKSLLIEARLNMIGKKIKEKFDSVITLRNNEIKYIMKVIKCSENRGIALKGTTRKITSQEGGFLNFLRRLMTATLPLFKNVLTPLAIKVNVSLRCSYSKKSETIVLVISNGEMGDIMRMVKLIEKSGLLIKGISKAIKNKAKEQKG